METQILINLKQFHSYIPYLSTLLQINILLFNDTSIKILIINLGLELKTKLIPIKTECAQIDLICITTVKQHA